MPTTSRSSATAPAGGRPPWPREVAELTGARAYLIDDATEINPAWLEGVTCAAITAGASAPEHLVQDVVNYFKDRGATEIKEVETIEERVTFIPPTELTREMNKRGTAR